jgi:hypothetical protein
MAGRKKTADKGCHHKRGVSKGCHKKEITERKKPGPKPGFKRTPTQKIIGHTMPPKAQKVIESKYSALQKQMDQFGEHVASFVYNTNTEAGVKAMKMTGDIVKGIKAFKSEIRVARESLKPVFAG